MTTAGGTVNQIGFIGLGMMGMPMAHRLHASGCNLVVRDADPGALQRFLDAHPGAVAAQQDDDFSSCDIVITMLPDSNIVDAVMDAVGPSLRQGTCVIDMSSSDPARTRSLAARLGRSGIDMIDAPVSGGVKKAIDGSLAIMVGGTPKDVARCEPILASMGGVITHVGPVGAGHALKALNNYVSAAAMLATAEAIHAGVAFGIDAATVANVLNASTGKNNTTENKVHQFMLNGAFNSGFSLALQAKDVGIAAALGPTLGVPMQLAQTVSGMTNDALKTLGRSSDHTELYKYVAPPVST